MQQIFFSKSSGDQNLTFKFSVMQFSFWATWCSFFTFYGMYLIGQGYSYSLVGAILSLAIFSGATGQVFWGFLCDRMRSIKKPYMIANTAMLLLIFLLSLPLSRIQIMAAMSLLGFCQMPQGAVLDSWIMKKSGQTPLNYGFIRMWASIGFSCFGWVVGTSIDAVGFWVMFVFASMFYTINMITAFSCNDAAYVISKQQTNIRASYRKLIRNRAFVLFLIASLLIGIGNQSSATLTSVIVSSVGGGSNDLGRVIFFAAITELPFFFFSGWMMKHLGIKKIFFIACMAFITEYTLLIFADSVLAVSVGMAFQGIGFATLLPSLRYFANRTAAQELSTSAQTLTDAMNAGIAGTLASLLGGSIIQFAGLSVLFSICIVFALIAMWLFLKSERVAQKAQS